VTTPTAATRAALERATAHALQYLEQLDTASVAATATAAELRGRLGRALAPDGVDAVQVLDDLIADVAGGILGSAGGRFYGWVIGGSLPAALGADWLTSTWDQNAGLHACGPAAAVIEEVAGAWLKDLLRLPQGASFALVSGCQMAHATCLAAARHALLDRRDWDVERDGLSGAPRIRILTSSEYHGSLQRAVRLLGLGTGSIRTLFTDADGRLTPQVLGAALAESPDAPTIVILQAGDLNIGAFDPFPELIAAAHDAWAWVHVDGAFGLWAAASSTHQHLVRGVEAADSWATDGHKWLNVPYDCGFAFVAHPQAHRAAMTHRASYLTHSDDVRDQMDWNPEFSRRARGVSTYAALRELGRSGVSQLIDRCCLHAHTLVTEICKLDGAELLWTPQLNQGLVRFPDPRPRATAEDDDRRTDAVMAAVLATGEAFFTGTNWRGMRCMRVSVCNWRTNDRDVARSVAAVQVALNQVSAAN